MKEWMYPIFIILIVCAVFSFIVIAVNSSYDKLQLHAFNELNHTDYTIKQWRIYRYEIEKLHPFTGQR